jgi:hypothetical protein
VANTVLSVPWSTGEAAAPAQDSPRPTNQSSRDHSTADCALCANCALPSSCGCPHANALATVLRVSTDGFRPDRAPKPAGDRRGSRSRHGLKPFDQLDGSLRPDEPPSRVLSLVGAGSARTDKGWPAQVRRRYDRQSPSGASSRAFDPSGLLCR